MDFHPGGVDELMRGVGTDATQLFDEVQSAFLWGTFMLAALVAPVTCPFEKHCRAAKAVQVALAYMYQNTCRKQYSLSVTKK